ncbi:hypothetical protein F4553_003352 [Allocatelliglobosispora scoriae]|uniref:Lipoprotein n=1 Tax=Allocatelliglobosispora scoriae TaxID=643052 RepID=A0A841BSS6_9ACTN|nr:hypothetical protein [Allocatelliglobosispora scoriae]MBB5869973.1 hypothetical protein [Allocatelliglobosispora scoriae]
MKAQHLIGLSLLLLVSACTTDPGTSAEPGGTAGPEQSRAAASGSAVLAQTVALADQAINATNKAIVKCMEAKGFTRHLPGLVWEQSSSLPVAPSDDTLTADEAKNFGYGFGRETVRPTPSGPANKPNPQAGMAAADVEKYQQALGKLTVVTLGSGEKARFYVGGCYEKSIVTVFGDRETYVRLLTVGPDAANAVAAAIEEDPALVKAYKSWSSCMKGKGAADLAKPEEATERALRYYWPRSGPALPKAEALTKEIQLAVADVACSGEAKIHDAQQQAYRAQVDKYLADHEVQLVADQETLRAALGKAQQLLAS